MLRNYWKQQTKEGQGILLKRMVDRKGGQEWRTGREDRNRGQEWRTGMKDRITTFRVISTEIKNFKGGLVYMD